MERRRARFWRCGPVRKPCKYSTTSVFLTTLVNARRASRSAPFSLAWVAQSAISRVGNVLPFTQSRTPADARSRHAAHNTVGSPLMPMERQQEQGSAPSCFAMASQQAIHTTDQFLPGRSSGSILAESRLAEPLPNTTSIRVPPRFRSVIVRRAPCRAAISRAIVKPKPHPSPTLCGER